VVEPRCKDMCPAAEREQRTADKQLHELERVAWRRVPYGTDAEHAIKKYTRSGEQGFLVERAEWHWDGIKVSVGARLCFSR
jgi:hypothetical protein